MSGKHPSSRFSAFAGAARLAAVLGVAWSLAPGPVRGQDLRLSSNNPVMRVEIQGNQSTMVNTETKIHWRQQGVPVKITVQSMCPGQSFGLSVRAVELTSGAGTGDVALRDGMAPVDLIVSIPAGRRNEQATLRYTASATIAQGNSDEEGADYHVVTYTLVQQ